MLLLSVRVVGYFQYRELHLYLANRINICMKTLREMMDIVAAAQQPLAEGSDDLRAKLDLYNEKAFEAGHRHDDQAWRKYTKLAKQIADQLGLKYKVTGYGLEILEQGVAEGSDDNRPWTNKEEEKFRRSVADIEDMFGKDDAWTKTKQKQIKQQIKTKPMAGPKGQLPEQGVAEASQEAMANIDRLTRN